MNVVLIGLLSEASDAHPANTSMRTKLSQPAGRYSRSLKLLMKPVRMRSLACGDCETDIDRDGVAYARRLHRGPSLRIGEQSLKDGRVKTMAAAH